ncbi:hypothetical protein RRG08_018254 [Elysia crispata]|uniref:Uncharacterized protein n=1 Tax=Elysia crispata TaxID=231223 RepID=A0AAE1D9G5_9GAST|nr:hypothetical protein RRG08_018254 [Elysia crispata]
MSIIRSDQFHDKLFLACRTVIISFLKYALMLKHCKSKTSTGDKGAKLVCWEPDRFRVVDCRLKNVKIYNTIKTLAYECVESGDWG